MSRLPLIVPEQATGEAKALLERVDKTLGLVPNMTKVMANSPALLDGYLALPEPCPLGRLTPGSASGSRSPWRR